jgi:transcriptional regulator with XRE-family HTH domain
MSQKALADVLSVSPKTVSKWECGRGFPDVGILLELADTLKISTTELLLGELCTEESMKKTDAETAVSGLVWELYKKRQKKRKIVSVILAVVVFTGSLIGFIIALQKDNQMMGWLCGCICLAAGIGISIRLMNPRIRDWRQQTPITVDATVLEKKIRISGGGSATGYPAIVVRTYGDEKKTLDVVHWEIYDTLFPGDKLQITYQGFVLREYKLLEQGPVSREAMQVHDSEARFVKRYVKTVARWHHYPVADFVLKNGKKLTLRLDENWENPEPGSLGTLTWHGEYLDSWK